MTTEKAKTLFEQAAAFEAEHPEYAEITHQVDLTMEEYQAILSALYRPTILTSNSAGAPLYASLE